SEISAWIDAQLDHRMILRHDDPVVPELRRLGEPVYLVDVNPTAETIAKLSFDHALERGLPVHEVRLWETPRCFAAYRGKRETGT
ncbi:MAG TPA: 6-carboxytetrahydropterin synthase, partial [Pirellulaceae bacterium]